MTQAITPSQTIGPFSHEAWQWACAACTPANADGSDTITISGILRDGDGAPVNDGMIEAWTPGAATIEHEREHALAGFRRVPTDDEGRFTLVLSRAQEAACEPAALVTVFMRGLLVHQFSAVFLEDDDLERAALLNQVPSERRATLVAQKTGPASYAWDIRMQGENETVFFDYGGTP